MSTERMRIKPLSSDESLLVGVDDRLAEPPLVRRRRSRHPLPPEFARLLGPILLFGTWFLVTNKGVVDSRTLSSPSRCSLRPPG